MPTEKEIVDLEIDHEQFAGEDLEDPWDDPEQTDWPNHPPMEVKDEHSVGTDKGSH